MEAATRPKHGRTQYEGKNLARLLLAIAFPAALLYLRILLSTIASYTHAITTAQINRLALMSNLILAAFCLVQILCARYIQRLVPPRQTPLGRSLQYAAVLLMCVVFSLTGAIILEAFGYTFLLRTGRV